MKTLSWKAPATLGIMFDINARGAPSGASCGHGSDSETRALETLLEDDLIRPVSDLPGHYALTQRGQVFLHMLLDTPLPVSMLVDPRAQKQTS